MELHIQGFDDPDKGWKLWKCISLSTQKKPRGGNRNYELYENYKTTENWRKITKNWRKITKYWRIFGANYEYLAQNYEKLSQNYKNCGILI